jgi:hypothetical protein
MSAHQPKLILRIQELHLENPSINSCVRPLLGADFNKSTDIQHSVTSVLSSNSRPVGKVIRIYVCSHENHAI